MGERPRDRSVAAAEFEAVPAGADTEAREVGELDGVEQFGHDREALALAFEFMGQGVFGHGVS